MQARDVDELLGEVRRYVERVRQNELEQLLRRVPDLNEREQQRLDQVTRSLVKKVLHRPTSQLRGAASAPGRGAVIEALTQLTALLAPSPEQEPQTAPRLARPTSATAWADVGRA
jgi:glutamyl-tRNA reductase